MAIKTQTITTIIDDLDGTVIVDGSAETIRFSLDGSQSEIDLSKDNARAFRDVLKRYTKAGRPVTARRASAGGVKTERADLNAAREWLRAHGHQVADRGRIRGDLMELYRAST